MSRRSHRETAATSWDRWIRQAHRWVSVAFLAAVLFVTTQVVGGEEPAEWVYLLPLAPLALLALTGIYLFGRPYILRWRARGRLD